MERIDDGGRCDSKRDTQVDINFDKETLAMQRMWRNYS